MDADKMAKWLEMAKHFSGNDFWNDIFGQEHDNGFQRPNPAGVQHPSPVPGPPLDIMKTDREIIVVVDLPGAAKEDVELALSDGCLHLKGIVRPAVDCGVPVSIERFAGPFRRSVPLPEAVEDSAEIAAALNNGILTVRISFQQGSKRRIEIE